MAAPIDFYFDFTSPYGYFASTQIDALAAKYGRRVNWHPVLLGVVFKLTGSAPLPMIPLKGPYSLQDMERTARFHKIDYVFPPTGPLPTQAAARAMRWIAAQHGDDKAVAFAKSVFRACFVDSVNISQPEQVLQIASRHDVDPAALEAAINSDAVKQQLKNEVEQAIARGVFGAPFIFVDDEPFWGFDRFDQIEATLKNGKI